MNREELVEFKGRLSMGVINYLEDTFEERGVMNTCPHCVANEFMTDKLSCILEDLYQLGRKGNHRDLIAALYQNKIGLMTLMNVMDQVEEQTMLLFEEEVATDMNQTIN